LNNISLVIGWKFNNQLGMSTKDGEIIEFPGGIPSKEDQDKWRAEYTEYLSNTQYQRDRASAYPELEEQLDMIYHDKEDGTNNWFEAIKGVKEKYPKPS